MLGPHWFGDGTMASGKVAATLVAMGMAMVAAMPSTAADDKRVVAFNASVRVEVDADGKPMKVEAPADLPDAIRGYIEQRVASWQYQPAKVDGVPQAAVTYVSVNACAVPVDQGFRLGLDFDGNGVRVAGGAWLRPPEYPMAAIHGGTEASFDLVVDVQSDGRATLGKIDKAEVAGRSGAKEFEPLLRRWVKTLRFDPELVAGHPVNGQVRIPVDFILRDLGDRKALLDELEAKAKTSRECQMAATGDAVLKPVALQPSVTVVPIPAS